MGPNRLWEEGEKREWVYFPISQPGLRPLQEVRMGSEEVQGSFFPKKGHTGGVLGDSGYLQGLSLAPPWPLQSLWKRKPCLEEFLCLRCTLPAPHTHSVERLVSSTKV